MAQQYSSAPSYGTQHPPAPYYPLFNSPAGQHVSTGPTDLQHASNYVPSLQPVPSSLNAIRYDANASIHHQPVPHPFAHFNPDLLKHFPPPLPPPPPIPPNAHFAAAPGTPTGYAQFPPPPINTPPHPFPQSHYSHFPQLSPSLSGAPAQEQRSYSQTHPMHELRDSVNQTRQAISPAQKTAVETTIVETSGQQSLNGTGGDLDLRTGSSYVTPKKVVPPPKYSVPGLNGSVDHVEPEPRTASSNPMKPNQALQSTNQPLVAKPMPRPELKERAKAALLSLTPYNIQYESLLAEGVNSHVLRQLYEELGLNWKTPDSKHGMMKSLNDLPLNEAKTTPLQQQEQHLSSIQIPTAASNTLSTTKVSPSITLTSQTLSKASPGMERKDRIAQLLAAKAGKAVASGGNSKSQSPASPAEGFHPQASEPEVTTATTITQPPQLSRPLAQSEVVRQKMEQLKKEGKAKLESQQASDVSIVATHGNGSSHFGSETSQPFSVTTLPTPIREQFASLIPGLFMTSAEHVEDNAPASLLDDEVSDTKQAVSTSARATTEASQEMANTSISRSPQFPHKRSLAEDSFEEHPEAKRLATYSNDSTDVAMDVEGNVNDEASDGEIIEDETNEEDDGAYHPEKPLIFPYQNKQGREDNVAKQTEIYTMRKRIAEMEQRQSLKRVQSHVPSPTGSITTPTPTQTVTPQAGLNSRVAKLPEPVTATGRIEDRVGQSPRPLVKATPEQIAERAAQLKADFLRQRALRQKQLQEGIPTLNDEVTKTQGKLKNTKARLAQVQSDLKEYEASILRAREDEKQLLDQIESLEKQISEGISGQKHFSSELHDLKQQSNKEVIAQPQPILESTGSQATAQKDTPSTSQTTIPADSKNLKDSVNPQNEPIPSRSPARSLGDNRSVYEAPNLASPTMKDVPGTQMSEQEQIETGDAIAAETLQADQTLHTVATKVSPIQAEQHNDEQDEDSDEAMEESEDDLADSHMSIDEESDDSVSMSDSGSEEYEPAEPDLSQQSDEKMDSDEYDPEIGRVQEYDGTAEEEGDDYEPAENVHSMEISEHSSTPVVSLTPTPESAINNASVPTENAHDIPLGASRPPQVFQNSQIDDQQRDIQLSEADTLTNSQNIPVQEKTDGSHVLGSADPSPVRYVPYQSPLSSFKSYRFHPFFNDQVKTGYRSLTYSHKIDPKMPMCLTELNGIQCTDPQCQDQHFTSMALTDDKILVQMSSASDIKDKTLRDQYLIGLKQVIARLRQEGVKEFSAVADALSQYRRDWTAAQAES